MADRGAVEDLLQRTGVARRELLGRALTATEVLAPPTVTSFTLVGKQRAAQRRPWWRSPRLRPLAPIGRPVLRLARRARSRLRAWR